MNEKQPKKKSIGRYIVAAVMALIAVAALTLSVMLMVNSIRKKTSAEPSEPVAVISNTPRTTSITADTTPTTTAPSNYPDVADIVYTSYSGDISVPFLGESNTAQLSGVYEGMEPWVSNSGIIALDACETGFPIYIDLSDPFFVNYTYMTATSGYNMGGSECTSPGAEIPFWSPSYDFMANYKLYFGSAVADGFNAPEYPYCTASGVIATGTAPTGLYLILLKTSTLSGGHSTVTGYVWGSGSTAYSLTRNGSAVTSMAFVQALNAYDTIFAEGSDEGYDLGYGAGNEDGYDSGYEAGYTSGAYDTYDDAYDEGYTAGTDDGYDTGYTAGYNAGASDNNVSYSDGYDAGYAVGYDTGKAEIQNSASTFSSLFFNILDAPFDVIRGAFNFEIFGINVASVLLFFVSVAAIAFLLKFLLK